MIYQDPLAPPPPELPPPKPLKLSDESLLEDDEEWKISVVENSEELEVE